MVDSRCKSINNCYMNISVLYARHIKIMMEPFGLECKEIEDNLSN
jgi:hypothetical protein